MTLETIYYLSQTIAVFVIIATLLALLIQTRQANRLAKLESSRAIWMDAGARIMAMVDDDEKADFMQRALFGSDDLTDAEKTRFFLYMASMFTTFENAHTMHLSGMMEERFWPRMLSSMRDYIAPARAQRWWELARKRSFGSNPEFAAAVDAVIAEANAQARP